jgi:hypothetical protein
MKKTLAICVAILSLTACGPQIYKSQNFDGALAKHKTVAILPAEVTMLLRPNEAKRTSPEQIAEMTQKTGYDIQDKMQSWLLRRSDKFNYTVTFQDVNRTNAKLKDAGVKYTDLREKDRADIARILGVDAVMQSRVKMDKPMSDGAALAVGLLVGAWGATNNVQTSIKINDGKTGDILWTYDYQAAGSVGSSSQNLVDALMRNASKKFPYQAGK